MQERIEFIHQQLRQLDAEVNAMYMDGKFTDEEKARYREIVPLQEKLRAELVELEKKHYG